MAKDSTRARILDAAVDQFAHYGFDHATIKLIADVASVAPATV